MNEVTCLKKKSIWEDVSRLYANAMLFYVSILSICEFCYLQGVLERISFGCKGTALYNIQIK